MVLQPSQKVVKPDAETDYDRRLQALESQINELKSFLLLNEGDCLHKNNKEAQGKWARGDSTPDLRRVKTEALAPNVALSVFSALFCVAALRDPTTTRKASAPSCTV